MAFGMCGGDTPLPHVGRLYRIPTPPVRQLTPAEHRAQVELHLNSMPYYRTKYQGRNEVWYRSHKTYAATLTVDVKCDVFYEWGKNSGLKMLSTNTEVKSKTIEVENCSTLTMLISSDQSLDRVFINVS